MSNELLYKKLLDIDEAISKIKKSFENIKTPEDFLRDQDTIDKLDAISMRLQAIGEVLKKISKDFLGALEQHPEVDWKGAINFRDKISHHYFDIDSEEIYKICKIHIPILDNAIKKIIADVDKKLN
ncbi:MAG: HepT-like ribonuclease domain-containing protein [Bacteroidota bacterium]